MHTWHTLLQPTTHTLCMAKEGSTKISLLLLCLLLQLLPKQFWTWNHTPFQICFYRTLQHLLGHLCYSITLKENSFYWILMPWQPSPWQPSPHPSYFKSSLPTYSQAVVWCQAERSQHTSPSTSVPPWARQPLGGSERRHTHSAHYPQRWLTH